MSDEVFPPGVTVADWLGVRSVVLAYARHMDARDFAGVAAQFTDDAVVHYAHLGGELVGAAEVERYLTQAVGRGTEATSHHCSNIEITFDGPDAATVETYLYAWHRLSAAVPHYEVWGRYHDRVVRTATGWRIAERRLQVVAERGRD